MSDVERIKAMETKILTALGDTPQSINTLEAVGALREAMIAILALAPERDAAILMDRFAAGIPVMLDRAQALRARITGGAADKPN